MALNIKDPETDRLVRELAALTGQPITEAVREAVKDKLKATRARRAGSRADRMRLYEEIAARGAALPDLDDRTPDEIIGYDENGLPA
jgi:antitoxin VapB